MRPAYPNHLPGGGGVSVTGSLGDPAGIVTSSPNISQLTYFPIQSRQQRSTEMVPSHCTLSSLPSRTQASHSRKLAIFVNP
jgi:hypothetical protein